MWGSGIRVAMAKVRRDRRLGWRVVLGRGARYLAELTTARLRLRAVDEIGPHARTLAADAWAYTGDVTEAACLAACEKVHCTCFDTK